MHLTRATGGGQVSRGLRRALLAALTGPVTAAPFYSLMRGRATVFMLHRFRDPGRGIEGTDPTLLRRGLDLLRRRRFEFVPLLDLFHRLKGEGRPLRRAVAFTIDDGYAEQAEVAGPVFAEFDCPVTTFVTTGFLDGALWFWWDQVERVFHETRRSELAVQLEGEQLHLAWATGEQRAAAAADFIARVKLVPHARRQAAIENLAAAAEVTVPPVPPPASAPMTWEQLRACESRGMSFGPHTVTHPILSRTEDAVSRSEIADSWARLRQEARSPVPIFCYPNGGWADFGEREIATLRGLEFEGAVVGEWGVANRRDFASGDRDAAFRLVRRLPFPDDLPKLVQFASGMEVLNLAIRRMRR